MTPAPAVRPRIEVRTPELDFEADIPRDWMAGNAVSSHLVNGLNLVFPDGERFFIRAIRDCTDDSLDPALRQEIRGFNGQEGRHAHEHERWFGVLERQGYQISGFLRFFHGLMQWMNGRMPAALRLAITAGAEHYTAIFGAFALQDPLLDDAHPTMRKLILWHATEEIEHKHVAFDVLQATHPSVWLRRLGFVLATLLLFGFSAFAARMLMRQDVKAGRIGRATLTTQRRDLQTRQSNMVGPMRDRIRAYWRRDFHPSETDERPLAYEKLAEVGLS